MQDFIPSKDVQAYMQRTGFTFSDRDLATVIFQSDLPLAQRHEALEQLAQKSADSELCRQIGERIAYERRATERFAENDGRFLYQLLLVEEGVPVGFFPRQRPPGKQAWKKPVPFPFTNTASGMRPSRLRKSPRQRLAMVCWLAWSIKPTGR